MESAMDKRIVEVAAVCILAIAMLLAAWKQTKSTSCEPTEMETETTATECAEPTSEPEPVFEPVIEKKEVQIVEQANETKPEPFFCLSDEERYITECVVMGEAGAEPYEGQVLVAQCILNGCLKEDVQPSELRKMYKYSGFKKNATESVKKAVRAVFDDGFKITDEPILYFYAHKLCKSKWHESQCFVLELDNQRFFKEKER